MLIIIEFASIFGNNIVMQCIALAYLIAHNGSSSHVIAKTKKLKKKKKIFFMKKLFYVGSDSQKVTFMYQYT